MPLIFGSAKASLPFNQALVLSNTQDAGAVNLTVVTDDGSGYVVHWGDGNSSIKSSGSIASHTYASAFDGDITVNSYGNITSMVSTAGGWNFAITDLPSTLLTLDFSDPDVAIIGLAGDLPPSLVYIDLGGTDSNIDGEFFEAPATITHFDVSGTDSTLISFISNMPDTLAYFNVTNTSVEVYGDMSDMPATLTYFGVGETDSAIVALSQETGMTTGIKFVDLSNVSLGSGAVDDILIALAKIASWAAPKTLDIGGNNAPRTSASDAAVATLEGLGVTVTVNVTAPPVPGEIDFIEGETAWLDQGGSITIDKPVGTIENSAMIAFMYLDGTDGSGTFTPPDGTWLRIGDYESGLGRVRNLSFFKKKAGASEPADYTFTHDGPATVVEVSGAIVAFTDVDITDILDVAYVEGSHVLDDGGEPFTAPNITTVTDGAWVLLMQAVTHSYIDVPGAPTGFDLIVSQVGTQDGQILIAAKEITTAGAVTPGDWTSTFTDTAGAATTVALALRPTVTGGEPIPEPEGAVLNINQAASAADLIVTTHDDSTYIVDWGDGSISAEIPSGTLATHTYATAYDGYVIIHSDGDITAIESAAGGWEFPLCCLPSTLTSLKVYGIGVTGTVTGALSELPSGLTDLQLYNTSAEITGDLGDEPAGMETMYLSNTSSVIGGASADMASTFVNLSLRLTDSTAAFDLSDIPSGMRVLRLHDSLCTIDASAGTMLPTEFGVAELASMSLSSEQVDDIITSFSTITDWVTPARIGLDGSNDPRTTAVDAEVATLEGNGVTVLVSGIVDEPGDGEPGSGGGGPVTRVGIVYTSSVEDGQIYPDSSADDGWRDAELHDTEPYRSQCFQVLAASDTDGITPREGNYCMRFYWQRNWPKWGGDNPNKTRAELKRGGNLIFGHGDEIWMGWSIFLPDEAAVRTWVANTNTNQSVTQWHDLEGDGTSQLMARSDRWEWAFGNLGKQFCGTVQFGVWTDFVMHAKVANDGTGFCKLWVNADSDADTPVYNRSGATLRGGVTQLYHKIGVYNQDFDNQTPVIAYIKQYHDVYRIGNATSNFESVAPGPASQSSPTREDVVYFSGAESGPNWPAKSSTEDGWGRQHFAGHMDEALGLVLASDYGISARAGDRVMRAYYNYASWGDDSNGKIRSEVLQPGGMNWYNGGPEYWVGFSIFVGKDNANNQALIDYSGQNAHIFQFHAINTTGTSGMNMHNGRWDFSFGDNDGSEQVIGDPIELGVWYDFVLNFKLSTGSDGFTRLWINADSENDTPAYSYFGDNGSRWPDGMYFKMGTYTNAIDGSVGGTATYAEHFYDEVRIATGPNANFNSVKPG